MYIVYYTQTTCLLFVRKYVSCVLYTVSVYCIPTLYTIQYTVYSV